jgi:hypothetical protein
VKQVKIALLFVPGWTVVSGSPHLALPLLRAFLESNGVEVMVRDLNHEFVSTLKIEITSAEASSACSEPTLENLNIPYFRVEDELMALAAKYNGQWNAQIGFSYKDSPHNSSRATLDCLTAESPFDDFYEKSIFPSIASESPDIVGFCIASVEQLVPAMQFARRLRSKGYDGFIVFGGNTVSRLIRELAIPEVFSLIDGLVSFQGEKPLLELCHALQYHRSLYSVSNLTWLNAKGEIVTNHGSSQITDLETFPAPSYEGLAVDKYWGENYLNLVSARGCYYGKCTFCAIPFGWGDAGYAGTRSANATYQDMSELAKRHGIRRFKFVDEALSPTFMRQLSKRILEDGADFEWEGYVRLERDWYQASFVNLVGRAGFRKGYFGLEVVPSKGRDFLNKNDRPRPESLLANCVAAGVKAHLFCMFGYPGTGQKEAEDTFQFLIKHLDQIDTVDIFPWTLAKHTTIPGVQPVLNPQKDWALEYDHVSGRKDILSAEAIANLASEYEELLWLEAPRLLHPTYRLVSPWSRNS